MGQSRHRLLQPFPNIRTSVVHGAIRVRKTQLRYVAASKVAAALALPPGKVAVIDNRTRTLITTYNYPNGRIRPHGVFYEPQQVN